MEPYGSVQRSLFASDRFRLGHGELDVVASAADLEPQRLRWVHDLRRGFDTRVCVPFVACIVCRLALVDIGQPRMLEGAESCAAVSGSSSEVALRRWLAPVHRRMHQCRHVATVTREGAP